MSRPLLMRLLAAALLAVPVAFLFFTREQARLTEWTNNPQAAQTVYMNFLRHNSIGLALFVSLVLIVGVTVVVEAFSCVLSGGWRHSTQ
jgi:hypothetical protein